MGLGVSAQPGPSNNSKGGPTRVSLGDAGASASTQLESPEDSGELAHQPSEEGEEADRGGEAVATRPRGAEGAPQAAPSRPEGAQKDFRAENLKQYNNKTRCLVMLRRSSVIHFNILH